MVSQSAKEMLTLAQLVIVGYELSNNEVVMIVIDYNDYD